MEYPKRGGGSIRTLVSNDRTLSFGSFSSLPVRDAPSKHNSNSEANTSLASSGQIVLKLTMTKEKLKAERLQRAKMFAVIIKSGGSKLNDLATEADPVNECAKAPPADDMNVSTPDLPPVAKEREGSSVPFEREGSITDKERKD
jgi:hypothetical protein